MTILWLIAGAIAYFITKKAWCTAEECTYNRYPAGYTWKKSNPESWSNLESISLLLACLCMGFIILGIAVLVVFIAMCCKNIRLFGFNFSWLHKQSKF